MQIQENFPLRPFNTFGIAVNARYFARFRSLDELGELLERRVQGLTKPLLLLGGGSNILFTKDPDAWVLKNDIPGIEIVREAGDEVFVRAGAGENWHNFVLFCIENGLGGIENLSLIPGQVGAAPMQNIGAYGVEIKDVFHELEAFHLSEKKSVVLGLKDCAFGYRESVFKTVFKNQFCITNVTFRLTRKHAFNISYGAIAQELEAMGVQDLSIRAVSNAVIRIRSSKLPDPKQIGNAGSFFKNPVVDQQQFDALKVLYPAIPAYPAGAGQVKLAAGWLIEQCGWKGYRKGDAGCHEKQALVLVNYGNATGEEVYELSSEILKSVQEKFGVTLEREVNIWK
ncbi:UDP-N-acetylmuramate dehydrogenase [Parasegetibacter sp. NRK P23]|uniref:UDP-N-acetylmuramate dehydrogenase n=1 Tax=Parasegetibacter sp. NRK P23 TaxID=2942999 RepID=UPI002044CC98|nr:UDP-N-acetylmuramate dehydrogenase [Parasegetibacter sp. NRK P23]MCM5527306.1 UDP-N-acetylmuramate dehydrogenase [Parasegetibacter sp. NRK P23]